MDLDIDIDIDIDGEIDIGIGIDMDIGLDMDMGIGNGLVPRSWRMDLSWPLTRPSATLSPPEGGERDGAV